jgi:hypothetical protein
LTPSQKFDLGISPRDTPHTPIPVPATAPVLKVRKRSGTMIQVQLSEDGSLRRGRPRGVDGARVYSFIGTAPPTDNDAWVLEGQSTRTLVDLTFAADTAPGTSIFLTACWYNPRGEVSQACQPIQTFIAGGSQPMEEAV